MNLFNHLPARLFWDVDLNDLNAENHATWITLRVFERGTLEDIWELHRYYGRGKVAEILKNAPTLKKSDMNLAALLYQLQPSDFLCYKQHQFRPRLLVVLDKLMQIEDLQNFRLVGGTALALQLGHRVSVDIDLFTDRSFDTNQVLQSIVSRLPIEQVTRTQIGLTFFTDDIKVDLCNWSVPFLGQPIVYNKIRMSPPEDIAAMKLDAITSRKDKKDITISIFCFWKNHWNFI